MPCLPLGTAVACSAAACSVPFLQGRSAASPAATPAARAWLACRSRSEEGTGFPAAPALRLQELSSLLSPEIPNQLAVRPAPSPKPAVASLACDLRSWFLSSPGAAVQGLG